MLTADSDGRNVGTRIMLSIGLLFHNAVSTRHSDSGLSCTVSTADRIFCCITVVVKWDFPVKVWGSSLC